MENIPLQCTTEELERLDASFRSALEQNDYELDSVTVSLLGKLLWARATWAENVTDRDSVWHYVRPDKAVTWCGNFRPGDDADRAASPPEGATVCGHCKRRHKLDLRRVVGA